MTLPNDLVQAAAEVLEGFGIWPEQDRDAAARQALAAAFAKLPGCQEAKGPSYAYLYPYDQGWRDCLATLASMADREAL